MFLRDPLKDDPGPCPVDDAPHHTCVPPGYVPPAGSRIVVPPFQVATSVTVPVQSGTVATCTTTSYRREQHSPAAVVKKAARKGPRR